MATENSREKPLLVCYVPGLDERHLCAELTPNTCSMLQTSPSVGLKTIPTTELVPTMITGVLPHDHRVWQVSLRPGFRTPSRLTLTDRIPDLLTTTIQCVRHLADRSYDLAVVPHWRRRRFRLHRFKYTRREAEPECMQAFGGYQTIFGILGDRSKYVFTKNFAELNELARSLPASDHVLTLVEMYALDLLQHWHLDNPTVMADALKQTDDFIGQLIKGCHRTGKRLVLLVDHGQEPVTATIPLIQAASQAGVSRREYTFFVELASARFWFHTDRARDAILPRLEALAHTTVLHWKDMHEVGVCFEDDSFGEFYAIADAGKIFFPHDFYQPIGNAILGATDRHQRQRMTNPVHRGNHGYLPHFPSERGWITTTDGSKSPGVTEGHILDIAPTLLSLAGVDAPPHMRGRTLFSPASRPS